MVNIEQESFGRLSTGEEITKYKLSNQQLQINVLNYGGIISEIYAPDREGKQENIVLGFDNLRDYEEKSPYFGAIIGRNAGRIAGSEFELKGQKYKLTANEGENNLHSGPQGFDKKVWEVTELETGLEMKYESLHLDLGFPGIVEFKVRYLLKDKELIIEYEGIPDRATIINLTNHTYFNLSGAVKRDILNHQLKINANKFLPLNRESIPTGEKREVAGTPFDFRVFKAVGKEIDADHRQLKFTGGYDHPFVLNNTDEENIILKEKTAGRVLKMTTDQPVVVFYSGNSLGEEGVLGSGVKSRSRLGLCLETQDYPNAINKEQFPANIYSPNNKYKAVTKYKFMTE